MIDFPREPARMVRLHLKQRTVGGQHALKSMRRVPKEAFVPQTLQELVYDNVLMIQAIEIRPGDWVWKVGATSGDAARRRAVLPIASTRSRHAK
jgi:protein-L-isoaspartate O-methyltransferase